MLCGGHLLDCGSRFVQVVVDGHENQLFGLVFEDGLDRIFQLLTLSIESGQDDCDIFRGQGGLFGRRNRLEGPKGPQVDYEAQVAVDAG